MEGPYPTVVALQKQMVGWADSTSFAQSVVNKQLKCTDIEFEHSVDANVLRSQLYTLKAMFKEYVTKAEMACYEIENFYKAESSSSPAKISAGGAVVTGKVQNAKKDTGFTEPTPQASPIPLLEAIADLITAHADGSSWDLLRDDRKGNSGNSSTVGIRLALNLPETHLRPLQIQFVIPGSSAHICGVLSRGDEILAVDGNKALESEIVRQVKGSDIVGSKVCLTVRKGGTGKIFDAVLVRGAWGAVERREKLFILFDELQKIIKTGASKEEMQTKLSAIVEVATDYERYRAVSDMTIHDRLHHMQSEIHRLLEVSTQRIQSLETMYSSAYQFINTQMPEITLSLHERVETYIKKLQNKLKETEDQNKLLQRKVDSVEKWMDAIKAMENLASFSRRKIRNWESTKTQPGSAS